MISFLWGWSGVSRLDGIVSGIGAEGLGGALNRWEGSTIITFKFMMQNLRFLSFRIWLSMHF